MNLVTPDSICHIEKQFPRLAMALVEHYATSGYVGYLEGLLFTDRPDREGFPMNIAAELQLLLDIAIAREKEGKEPGAWDGRQFL